MEFTAINIALRLPEAWDAEARRLNGLLPEQPNPVPLASGKAVPHITLAMGVVGKETLAHLRENLNRNLAGEWRMNLTPSITYLKQELGQFDVSGVAVRQNETLQDLHRRVMHVLEGHWVPPIMGAVDQATDWDDSRTLDLINNFQNNGSGSAYRPHITLGLGALPDGETFHAEEAVFDTLTVFTLGPLCTCRRELFQLDLADNHDVAQGGFSGGWRISG